MFFGNKESTSSYVLTSHVVIASAGSIHCLNNVRSTETAKFQRGTDWVGKANSIA